MVLHDVNTLAGYNIKADLGFYVVYGVRVFDTRVSVIINMNLLFLIAFISSSESLVQLFVLF
ncbi:hypothetical protein Hanom_Chr01g00084811 [Helianthus anomalus]